MAKVTVLKVFGFICMFFIVGTIVLSVFSALLLAIIDDVPYEDPRFRSSETKTTIHTVFSWNSYNYGFLELQFDIDKKLLQKTVKQFGIKGKVITDDGSSFTMEIQEADEDLKKKGYILDQNKDVIEIDYKTVWKWNVLPVKKIAEEFKKLIKLHKLSYRDSLNLIISFLQDMEYSLPPTSENGKIISGLWVPLRSISAGKGDCDTKAIIFACILRNIYETPIICISGNNHLFSGMKAVPKKHEYYMTYGGDTYVLFDVTGPRRMPFGVVDDINKVIINKHNYRVVLLK